MWAVRRRYSAFAQLRETLSSRWVGAEGQELLRRLAFPPKLWRSGGDPAVIQDRMISLERWLNHVLAHTISHAEDDDQSEYAMPLIAQFLQPDGGLHAGTDARPRQISRPAGRKDVHFHHGSQMQHEDDEDHLARQEIARLLLQHCQPSLDTAVTATATSRGQGLDNSPNRTASAQSELHPDAVAAAAGVATAGPSSTPGLEDGTIDRGSDHSKTLSSPPPPAAAAAERGLLSPVEQLRCYLSSDAGKASPLWLRLGDRAGDEGAGGLADNAAVLSARSGPAVGTQEEGGGAAPLASNRGFLRWLARVAAHEANKKEFRCLCALRDERRAMGAAWRGAGGALRAAVEVSGRVSTFYAAVLTGICLYAARSCHKIKEWKRPTFRRWKRTPRWRICWRRG
jgi:hypothetical protein